MRVLKSNALNAAQKLLFVKRTGNTGRLPIFTAPVQMLSVATRLS